MAHVRRGRGPGSGRKTKTVIIDRGYRRPQAQKTQNREDEVEFRGLEGESFIMDEIPRINSLIHNFKQVWGTRFEGNIEIEVGLLIPNRSDNFIRFTNLLQWLNDRLSRAGMEQIQPVPFFEIQYTIDNVGRNQEYDIFHVTRNGVASIKIKKKQGDKKKYHYLRLPTVGTVTPRLAVSFEIENSDINPPDNGTPSIRNRKRWSFPISFDIYRKLGLEELVPIPKDIPFVDDGFIKAVIDITENITEKSDGTQSFDYSIEIELDSTSIDQMDIATSIDIADYIKEAQIHLLDIWIKVIIVVLNQSGAFMVDPEIKIISKSFNSIFSKTSNVEDRINNTLANQPKDLQKRDMSWLNPLKSDLFMQSESWDDDQDLVLQSLRSKRIFIPLMAIEGGYYATLKADGTRFFLYFKEDGIYLIRPFSSRITKITGAGTKYPTHINILSGTIIDGEVITELDAAGVADRYEFLAFDILSSLGKDVRNLTYSERLRQLKLIIQELYKLENIKGLKFLAIAFKPVYKLPSPSNLVHKASRVLKENEVIFQEQNLAKEFFSLIKRLIQKSTTTQKTNAGESIISWETDGLIFTPAERPYLDDEDLFYQNSHPKDKNFSLVRKWKPVITIDFKVVKNESGLLDLMVYDPGSESNLVSFSKISIIPWNGNLELREDMLLDQIWEFEWKESEQFLDYAFIPIRHRIDRNVPNRKEVAIAGWKLINDPLTIEDMSGETLSFMRRYHNRVKTVILQDLISSFDSPPLLLDLGSGRGGDINKWGHTEKEDVRGERRRIDVWKGFDKIYAVEPDKENFREFLSRLEKRETLNTSLISDTERNLNKGSHYGRAASIFSRSVQKRSKLQNKNKIVPVNARAEDLEYLLDNIPIGKIDCCTVFNALTFFYETRDKLQMLIETVKTFLKPGGYFYVMGMDGELLLNSMQKVNEHGKLQEVNTVKSENITISKAPDESCRKIFIKIEGGIVRGQFEYLIQFREFVHIMGENGFQLLDERYLNEETLLSDEGYWFSSLFKLLKFRFSAKPLKNEKLNFQKSQLKSGESEAFGSETLEKLILDRMESDRVLPPLDPDDQPMIITTTKLRNVGTLVRIGVPQDGSCYIHAILRAFSGRYKRMTLAEQDSFIIQIRKEMADNYTLEIHNSIGNGFFADSQLPAYSYENIKKRIATTNSWIGNYMMEFIGDQLETNVYILRGIDADIYTFGDTSGHIKPGRKNVVLYWINNNHYETVGQLLDPPIERNLKTVFEDDHPLIKAFRK